MHTDILAGNLFIIDSHRSDAASGLVTRAVSGHVIRVISNHVTGMISGQAYLRTERAQLVTAVTSFLPPDLISSASGCLLIHTVDGAITEAISHCPSLDW